MKTNRRLFLLIFLTLGTFPFLSAQFQNQYFQHRRLIEGKSQELYLAVRGAGFFNNNEYFDTYTEGYTLIGNYFQPVMHYYFNPSFSLAAGVHVLKYHGQEGFAAISPWFSISYTPTEKLRIAAGSFNKGALLNLPEALYSFENQFTDLTGNGIMINYSGKWWNSVSWLDWISFIEPGDFFQEEFIFGHSGAFTFVKNDIHRLDIPYYILAEHKGGQININEEPVKTRLDYGGGMEWGIHSSIGVFNEIKLKGEAYLESQPDSPKGKAFLSYAELRGEALTFGLGYFYEKNWQSILGLPLLFDPENLTYPEGPDYRHFLLFKAGFGRHIGENSSLSLRLEAYYDLGISKMQYTYGLHIIVDEWIRLFSREDKTAMVY